MFSRKPPSAERAEPILAPIPKAPAKATVLAIAPLRAISEEHFNAILPTDVGLRMLRQSVFIRSTGHNPDNQNLHFVIAKWLDENAKGLYRYAPHVARFENPYDLAGFTKRFLDATE